jgi:hypothetical protein
MPHVVMVALFGGVFLFAVAIAMSVRAFWRATGGGSVGVSAVFDAGQLPPHCATSMRW